MGQGRGVNDGSGDIVGRSERRRQRYLGKNRLDFGGDKDIFDERGDDGALADSLVTAYTDSDWGTILVNSHGTATSTNTGLAPPTGRHISACSLLTAYRVVRKQGSKKLEQIQ